MLILQRNEPQAVLADLPRWNELQQRLTDLQDLADLKEAPAADPSERMTLAEYLETRD